MVGLGSAKVGEKTVFQKCFKKSLNLRDNANAAFTFDGSARQDPSPPAPMNHPTALGVWMTYSTECPAMLCYCLQNMNMNFQLKN
jgi:hypothetical protein